MATTHVLQQSGVSSMHSYGYELAFIREREGEKWVVMKLHDSVIIIDEDGNVETEPDIKIRK